MPLYEFQLVGGTHRVEKFYSIAEAPDLGTQIEVDGKKYIRIMSTPQIDADVKNRARGYPYVSNALPLELPGAQHTPEGKPIIRSRLHEKEVAARHGLIRD
jgi:hypothetical protein